MKAAVEVGYIARPHGTRGELRVVLHNPDSTALDVAERVRIDGVEYRVARVRYASGAALVTLEGIADRDAAAALRGRPICVDRADLDLEDGDVLLAELVGCDVVLEDGRSYGRVERIDVGPQSRLVIWDGDVERLLPIVPELVVDVDLDARRVVVAPPEGLPESPIPPRRERP